MRSKVCFSYLLHRGFQAGVPLPGHHDFPHLLLLETCAFGTRLWASLVYDVCLFGPGRPGCSCAEAKYQVTRPFIDWKNPWLESTPGEALMRVVGALIENSHHAFLVKMADFFTGEVV